MYRHRGEVNQHIQLSITLARPRSKRSSFQRRLTNGKKKKERKRRKRGKSYTLVKISRLLSKSLSPAHRSIHDQRNFVLINPTQFQPETAGWRKIFRQIIRPSILDTGWRRTGVISSSSGLFRHVRRRIRAEVTFQGLYREGQTSCG